MRTVVAAVFVMVAVVGAPPASASEVQPACVPPPPRQSAVLPEAPDVTVGVVETEVRWTRWSTRLVHGQPATLAGQVVTEAGAVADTTVELYARTAGAGGWTHLGAASSDPDTGVFAFNCLPAPETTTFRVVYEGTPVYRPSEAGRTVPVARRVPDGVSRRAAGGFWFSGSVRPGYAGGRVLLQRRTCGSCSWSVVTRTDADARSRWRFVLSEPRSASSSWSYRAVVPADDRFVTGVSDHVWRITRD